VREAPRAGTTVPIEIVRRHSAVSDVRGALDLALVWGTIVLALAVATSLGTWWAYLAAVVVIGSRQAALVNLAHDAWHGLCFNDRRLNHWVGAWLYSYAVGLPHFHDRRRHLMHHRMVGERRDPDWVNYTNMGRETAGRVVRFLTGRLLGSLLYDNVASAVLNRKPPIAVFIEAPGKDEPDVGTEMKRVIGVQLVLAVAMTLLFGWWTYPVLWVLPMATVAAFCINVRAYVEHAAPTDEAGPSVRLRDIDAGPLERVFFSPAHFHFHALHHAYPSIPHYSLAAAKRDVIAETGAYPFTVIPGYLRSLRTQLDALPS